MRYLLAIMVLSFIDTFNTLYILQHGGTEVNPFMKYLLVFGEEVFIVVKNVITLLGLWVLTKYKKYGILIIIIFIYLLLIIYQLKIIYIIKGIIL
jgi:hypothetical protein